MSGMAGTELVDWRTLPPAQRRAWWDHIWSGAVRLAGRYRLALRSGWWQDQIQVEALAAFICWLELYDSGANADPTGKVQLLWELERLRGLLRAGEHAFHPGRDRGVFERYVDETLAGAGEAPTDAGEPLSGSVKGGSRDRLPAGFGELTPGVQRDRGNALPSGE
jgi:hypothetical protein